MATQVKTLQDLLQALGDAGALSFVDCGDIATLYFNQGGYGDDNPKAEDIRFLDKDYQSDWQVEVETGMCGSLVDVYVTKPEAPKYSDDDAPF